MAKETKPKEETPKPDAAAEQPKPKAGLPGWIWYAVYGVAGLVLIGAVAFGTLLMLGGKKNVAVEPASTELHASADSLSHETTVADSLSDSLAEPVDSATLSGTEIEKMLQSIEALDQPTAEDMATAEGETLSAEERDSAATPELFKAEKEKLAAREAEINRRQKDLEIREQKLAQQFIKLEQASSQKIIELAKLYDAMRPEAVAELMANLDDTTVVSIIPRMKPKAASLVLQLIPPPRAASISKQIITLAKD